MLSRISFLILFIALVSSCSIEKKHYSKGYYVQWNKKTYKEKENGSTNSTLPYLKTYVQENRVETYKNEPLVSTTSLRETIHLRKKDYKLNSVTINTSRICDSIVLNTGEVILGLVDEVNPDEIKYLPCGSKKSTLIRIKREKVNRLKYPSGDWDYFKSQTEEEKALEKEIAKSTKNNWVFFNMITFFLFMAALITAKIGFLGIIMLCLTGISLLITFGLAIRSFVKAKRALKMIGNDKALDLRYGDRIRSSILRRLGLFQVLLWGISIIVAASLLLLVMFSIFTIDFLLVLGAAVILGVAWLIFLLVLEKKIYNYRKKIKK